PGEIPIGTGSVTHTGIPTHAETFAPEATTPEGPPHGETTPTVGSGTVGIPAAEWTEASSIFKGTASEGKALFEQARDVELAKLLEQGKFGQAWLPEQARFDDPAKLRELAQTHEMAKFLELANLLEQANLLEHAKLLAQARSGQRMPLEQAKFLAQESLGQEVPFDQAPGVPPWILSLVERPLALGADHPWSLERGVDGIILHHRGVRPAMPLWLSATRVRVPVDVRGAALVQAIPACEGRGAVPV